MHENTTHTADLALADAIRRKDRKATAELVECHADAVYGYVLARLRPNIDEAEDLTQEVFLSAWQSIGTYAGQSPLRSWLLGVARHKVEDHYRARLREFALEEPGGPDPSTDIDLDAALDAGRLETRAGIVLETLREEYRLLLRWRYWDQQSTAEIARALGRTQKSVERMMARARGQFRRAWEAGR